MAQHPYDWQTAGDWEQPAAKPDRGERRPWWTLRKDTTPPLTPEHTAAPGVHVTIQPTAPPAPAVSPRKARIRWWVLRRGTAGTLGYVTPIGPILQARLDEAAPYAVGFAMLLWLVAWFAATKILLFVPRAAVEEVHITADWIAHIPSATVLVALALHAPGALQ